MRVGVSSKASLLPLLSLLSGRRTRMEMTGRLHRNKDFILLQQRFSMPCYIISFLSFFAVTLRKR